MFSIGGVLIDAVRIFIGIFTWLIIIRAILSWFRPTGYNRLYYDVVRTLDLLTEPIVAPIRNLMPTGGMGIDFSPWIALILLRVVGNLLVQVLYRLF